MKTALVLRHSPEESLDNLAAPLRDLGYRAKIHAAGQDGLAEHDSADLVLVLGGGMGVHEEEHYPFLSIEIDFLKRRIQAGGRTVGICLGSQLLAAALGARVLPGARNDIAWRPVELSPEGLESPLAAFNRLPVLHWHSDSFQLPQDAVSLASGGDFPQQAFAFGEHVLALQFHPEVSAGEFAGWLDRHAAEVQAAGLDPVRLQADADQHGDALAAASRAFLEDWLG